MRPNDRGRRGAASRPPPLGDRDRAVVSDCSTPIQIELIAVLRAAASASRPRAGRGTAAGAGAASVDQAQDASADAGADRGHLVVGRAHALQSSYQRSPSLSSTMCGRSRCTGDRVSRPAGAVQVIESMPRTTVEAGEPPNSRGSAGVNSGAPCVRFAARGCPLDHAALGSARSLAFAGRGWLPRWDAARGFGSSVLPPLSGLARCTFRGSVSITACG